MFCQSAPPGFLATATLAGTLDVVVGTEDFLASDGVVQGGVAGRVAAADARRDLDVLDELGETSCRAWRR